MLMQRGRLVQPAAAAAAADSVSATRSASGTTASTGAGTDVEASIVDPLARADFWSRVVGLASPLKVIIAQFAAPGLYTAIHRHLVCRALLHQLGRSGLPANVDALLVVLAVDRFSMSQRCERKLVTVMVS